MTRVAKLGTPAWYQQMGDDELQTTLHGLRSESRERLIVQQLIDDRAAARLRQRNLRLKVAAVLLVALACIAAAFALR